jgi:hypothetical protein
MLERASTGDQRPLPAPVPAAARAAISPSALVLAGVGTGVGVLVGLPVLAAVAIGAGFWGARVAAGAALASGRRRKARRPEVIDPFAVPDPWRSFVRESLTAQAKFDEAVARSHPGPLRDRMGEVSVRVHDGVRECWRVAHLGAALDAALGAINPERASRELRMFQETPGPGPGAAAAAAGGSGATETSEVSEIPAVQLARDKTEAALAAQLQAARRVEAAAQRATDRLRVLTAELNAAVAGAVELSLDAEDTEAAGRLAGDVESVVGEIQALRQALEEATEPDARPR